MVTLLGKEDWVPESQPVEQKLLSLLEARTLSLCTAESCTGGLIACRITDVPGASAVFLGSIVAYANAVKIAQLGVAEATLNTQGAVSEATAREMVQGVAQHLGADCALAVTGIAGPNGGSAEKPVGLVYISTWVKGAVVVTRNVFAGDRGAVKTQTADKAMLQLLEQLKG